MTKVRRIDRRYDRAEDPEEVARRYRLAFAATERWPALTVLDLRLCPTKNQARSHWRGPTTCAHMVSEDPSSSTQPKEEEAMPTTPKPKLARTTIGKGTAPRRAAEQKAKVAESKQKLDALKARQAGEQPAVVEASATEVAKPKAKAPAKKASAPKAKPASEAKPELQFFVNDKPAIPAHNSLAGISRASGFKGGKRLPTSELRALLVKSGIAEPDRTPWEFTLPNGVVIAARKPAAARKAS